MRSLAHLQILVISLLLINLHVSPISTFSTAVLNNDESNKALYANSNVASDGASNVAPDLGEDEGAVGPEEVGAELEREPQSADSLTSDGKNEATEQLPVPQAASVGKTAKKILGFTLGVFIVLVLVGLFVICGCAFLLIRLCCS